MYQNQPCIACGPRSTWHYPLLCANADRAINRWAGLFPGHHVAGTCRSVRATHYTVRCRLDRPLLLYSLPLIVRPGDTFEAAFVVRTTTAVGMHIISHVQMYEYMSPLSYRSRALSRVGGN